MPQLIDDFSPARGLSNGHAQTVFGSLWPKRALALKRRRFETPDGDFVDVDMLDGAPGTPTVLLCHGLEGSSSSKAIVELLRHLAALEWGAWALNFRSCSGEPNRLAASYSSGDTRDVTWLVPQMPTPRAIVGVSLGGSVVLNAMSQGLEVSAAAAISAPYQLRVCAQSLDSGRGFSPVYLRHFLPTMKAKALEKAARFPRVLDAGLIRRAGTLRDFDHVVTAPAFGFASAEEYYERSSSGPKLSRIKTPTLLLSAEDDPLAPAALLPVDVLNNPALHVLRTQHGGHVGWVAGSIRKPLFWAEHRVVRWLAQHFQQLGKKR